MKKIYKSRLQSLLPFILLLVSAAFPFNSYSQILNWAFDIGKNQIGDVSPVNMVTDLSGNIIIAGVFHGNNVDFKPGTGTHYLSSNPTNQDDMYLAKYSQSGQFKFAFSFGSAATDHIKAMTVDQNDNIYLVGILYDSVDFDPGPNVYFLVDSNPLANSCFFAKYDSSGNFLWAFDIPLFGAVTQYNYINDIIIDASGNLCAIGAILSSQGFDFDPSANTSIISSNFNSMFIVKYNANGNYLGNWVMNRDAPNDYGENYKLRGDKYGNYYLAFYTNNGTIDMDPYSGIYTIKTIYNLNYYDVVIAKYDSLFNLMWVNPITDTIYKSQQLANLEVKDSSVYFLGRYSSYSGDLDPGPNTVSYNPGPSIYGILAEYDMDGSYVSSLNFAGGEPQFGGADIEKDYYGNLYLSGYIKGDSMLVPNSNNVVFINPNPSPFGGTRFFFMIKYNSQWQAEWATGIDGDTNVEISHIAFAKPCDVIVSGIFLENMVDFDLSGGTYFLSAPQNNDMYIASYNCSSILAISETTNNDEMMVWYDNANNLITINSNEFITGSARLIDVNGRIIFDKSLIVHGRTSAFSTRSLSKGIYFVNLISNETAITRKIVIY